MNELLKKINDLEDSIKLLRNHLGRIHYNVSEEINKMQETMHLYMRTSETYIEMHIEAALKGKVLEAQKSCQHQYELFIKTKISEKNSDVDKALKSTISQYQKMIKVDKKRMEFLIQRMKARIDDLSKKADGI